MSAIYDNWERLVAAVLRKEELWRLFHDHSRSPSVLSEASDLSSSFSLGSFDLGSSSRLQRTPPKLVLISDFSPAFGVDDLRLASAKLLGRGTFGRTYTAVMVNGVRIVVKSLKSVSISEEDFKRHMDIVGNVRHENVSPLRAYYSSKDERLMLYDHYSKGSVCALLHGQINGNQAHVDWETRLKIAIGAARGIAEIHSQNGGKFAHGNIKTSNIFLNKQKYGCISDLGLANMTEATFMPTAWCYAPEVKSSRNVSQASDVYSFGIVLLELLTRKSTTHLLGAPEPVDLVQLVGSVKSKDRAGKVFDADLMKYPAIREDMVKMLQIGLKCVAKSIKKRPKLSTVMKMLEDIGRMKHKSQPKLSTVMKMLEDIGRMKHKSHPLEGQLVFVEDANQTFDLDDMLRAAFEVLDNESASENCFKARLDNGNTVVVKRVKAPMILTFMDFQKCIEDIGRMRHDNVADIRAYYFSIHEKFVVYDFYNQGNVFAALHGKTGIGTRLKIAVGAARGIAHIHGQDGGKFVHGNIKSSNILVNEKKYGTVSDVGLANFLAPRPLQGYCAPEILHTVQASQASDVYSFGVVLLQLITGKLSEQVTDDGQVISLAEWTKSVIGNESPSKVFDVELLRYVNEKAMMQLLQIAMDCVAIVPEHRPRMPEIVKMLEEISGLYPSDDSSLEDVVENTWGQPSMESRLEDLLEELLPKLTP